MNIKETNTTHKESTLDIKKRPGFVKSLHSDSSNDESKSAEDQRQVFRPKFGKPWPKTSNQASSTSNYTSYPDIDLVKENEKFSYKKRTPYEDADVGREDEEKSHKSNVAKITFKTAKEQLLASNPAAKRTLGTSRKAQAKFVSPMIGAQ